MRIRLVHRSVKYWEAFIWWVSKCKENMWFKLYHFLETLICHSMFHIALYIEHLWSTQRSSTKHSTPLEQLYNLLQSRHTNPKADLHFCILWWVYSIPPLLSSLKLSHCQESRVTAVYSLMDQEQFACGSSSGSKCNEKYTSRHGLSLHQSLCKHYKLQQDVLAAKHKERAKATIWKKDQPISKVIPTLSLIIFSKCWLYSNKSKPCNPNVSPHHLLLISPWKHLQLSKNWILSHIQIHLIHWHLIYLIPR